VLAILRSLNESGRTVVLITHDPNVAAIPRRVFTMSDGRLAEEVAA
jgi:ABC-type lipoprotein export system ATPase subunit